MYSSGFGNDWVPVIKPYPDKPVVAKRKSRFTRELNIDNLAKSRIFPFFWIPAFAGMTIIQLISYRYHRRHTRAGGYPVFKTTFYDSINIHSKIFNHLRNGGQPLRRFPILFRHRKPGPQGQVRDNRLCYKVLAERG